MSTHEPIDVVLDHERGHVALVRHGHTILTVTDLGGTWQIDQHDSGVHLAEDELRDFARALYGSANLKRKRQLDAVRR